MNRKLNILHCVESYFPDVGGMQEVVRQLSERLVKLGHHVTVATRKIVERKSTNINGVEIVEFKIKGNAVNGIIGDKDVYEAFLLNSNYDVVTFFAAQQWATDIALPILDKIKGKKVSVPTGYSGFYKEEYQGYFENMKSWIHAYDMNVYLSHDYRDINFAKENGVTKNVVIPNGAGEDEFLSETKNDVRKELGIPANHFLILHVGSYTGVKGQQEAIEIFLRSSIKRGTLLMIGNNSENYRAPYRKFFIMAFLKMKNFLFGDKKIIFKSFSRSFTVAAYKQADLFLFPSNIECSPIVLFESAAAGLPFLSTDVGNSVEIASWTNGGKIIKTNKDENRYSHADINDAVKQLNQLYHDKTEREKLGEKAFTAWKERFSWEVITKQYESIYLNLTEAK